VNGYDDQDGCPEADGDGDGVIDSRDKCPKKPENINGVDDADGCPDGTAPDQTPEKTEKKEKAPPPGTPVQPLRPMPGDEDGDLVPDIMDQCPKKPENVNEVKDEDGCPD
jgi:hypothetical protein